MSLFKVSIKDFRVGIVLYPIVYKSSFRENIFDKFQIYSMHKKFCFVFRYVFIEYDNSSDASDAVKNMDGYKLDKSHTFRVNLFSDFEK